jgi:hypothetical protein
LRGLYGPRFGQSPNSPYNRPIADSQGLRDLRVAHALLAHVERLLPIEYAAGPADCGAISLRVLESCRSRSPPLPRIPARVSAPLYGLKQVISLARWPPPPPPRVPGAGPTSAELYYAGIARERPPSLAA